MSDEKKEGNPGNPHVTSELCDAYREHLETKINGMEKSIKMSIALCGFIISVVVLLSRYLPAW